VSNLSPHFAKSVVFTCIDDRLINTESQFIAKVGGAFHSAIAGGGLAFVSELEQATALKQVTAAFAINQVENVYLESHTDCGAYRLSGAVFHSQTEEVRRLYTDLDQAATLIRTALATAGAKPGEVTVHVRVVDPAGTVQERPEHATVA
jgi:carbonic anhydrase